MKSSGIGIPRPVPVDPAMVDSVGSFEDFYRTNAERVHRALAVTLGDPYLAQEATDEAMARACARWRRVGRLDNPGPGTIRRRAAAMRRRRAAGVAALSAVVAAASIGVPYAFAARPTGGTGVGQPAVASEPTPAAAAPAQRLILRDAGIVVVPGEGDVESPATLDPAKPNFGYAADARGVVSVGGLKELRPDGDVTTHPLSPGAADYGWALLDDGRLITASSRDLAPGTPRVDGPCVTDMEIRLEIHDRAGAVSLSRDIREVCRRVELVGATAEEAYLVRGDATRQGFLLSGAQLVAHRFADGSERVVLDNLDPLGGSVADLNLDAGLAAGLAAATLSADGRGCRLVVLSLTDGLIVADNPVLRVPRGAPADEGQHPNCDAVRLSPDGRLAAVATSGLRGQGPESVRDGSVLVVDLATGAVRAERHLFSYPFGTAVLHAGTAGLAWHDDATVVCAVVEPPAEPTRIYAVDEVVRRVTVPVP